MGWRDINMNRRKPRIDVAVVPRLAGEDASAAVLRKASREALAALQLQETSAAATVLSFAAGYLAGFARQRGLKHGVDAEDDRCAALLAALAALSPESLATALNGLAFLPRVTASARARLNAGDRLADAGYLVGHLESLCGTARLLALAPLPGQGGAALETWLTACDTAADRLQTHHPTAALRFDGGERDVLLKAFGA